MRHSAIGVGILAAWAAASSSHIPAATAATLTNTSRPYPGVTHLVYVESATPARIHVLIVDLSSSEISLHATAESQRGLTVSEFSLSSTAQVVVNGDYFRLPDFRPSGLAMGGAALWAGSSDSASSGFLSFDRNQNRSHLRISAPEDVVAAAQLTAGTQGVVGGRPMLLRAGIAESSFDCTDLIAMPCDRAPRTAIGVSTDGTALYIAVVDGWQSGSVGMTAAELADFLASVGGVHDALMLDGGGSSALYIAAEEGIVNSPSDGVERVVANHLGVRYGSLPTGQLVGFIRERDIFDESKSIEGATARLDTGTELTTGPDGVYNFPTVTPRLACVTASAPGYHQETRCSQVVSGQLTYNSIALFPNSEFLDAAPGAADAGIWDARTPRDGPGGGFDAQDRDGGMGGGGGGCACSHRDTGGGLGSTVILALLLVARLRPHFS